MKWLSLAAGSLFLVAAAVFTAVNFGSMEVRQLKQEVTQLEQEVDQLEQERHRLLEYARRLGASRRVAQVDVVRQRRNLEGHTVTTLVWQEIGPDGLRGKALAVEAVGTLVYFEARVIKFARNYVQEGDPDRGVSLASFRRIFGDRQAPESVLLLDRAARPPLTDPHTSPAIHDELWQRFQDLMDDPALAAEYGVRVVQYEAPAVPLQPGQIWEVTLDAAGGLNLKKTGALSSCNGWSSSQVQASDP